MQRQRFSTSEVLVDGSTVYLITERSGVVAAFWSREDAESLAVLLDRSTQAWPVVMVDCASTAATPDRLRTRARQALLPLVSGGVAPGTTMKMPTFGFTGGAPPDLPGTFLVFSINGGRIASFASRADAAKCVVVLHKAAAVWCGSVVAPGPRGEDE
jgi:hypothetical protein